MILRERRAPRLSGALAKAAAGAVDIVPVARVVNLSRALERLSDLGWRAVGLDGTAKHELPEVLDGTPVVLVLGSEGEGVRRLVAEHCDETARIPMPGGFESLIMPAAAAVALDEPARPPRSRESPPSWKTGPWAPAGLNPANNSSGHTPPAPPQPAKHS